MVNVTEKETEVEPRKFTKLEYFMGIVFRPLVVGVGSYFAVQSSHPFLTLFGGGALFVVLCFWLYGNGCRFERCM